MQNRKKINKLVLAMIALAAVICMVASIIKYAKKHSGAPKSEHSANERNELSPSTNVEKNLIVQDDNGVVKKIDISSGKIEDANSLEKEDFSGFSGLPQAYGQEKQNIDQQVIVSPDKSEAILTMTTYADFKASDADNQEQSILSSDDYLCQIAQKSCQKTNLLTQAYQGLDEKLQKDSGSFIWTAWDCSKKTLFGHLISEDAGDISPMYACNAEKKTCAKTEGYDLKKEGDTFVSLPNGSLSPSLEKFVMANLNDEPNVETGKAWQLLMYSSNDLSKPSKTYDLSAIIDHDQSVAYDAVYSVAWSLDEKRLAIGTARRIFMLDVESGSLSLAYVAPIDEEGDFYWDSSSLFLSPDAKFAAFIDESDESSSASVDDSDQAEEQVINVLKKIDLENSNKVSELLQGPGLGLE